MAQLRSREPYGVCHCGVGGFFYSLFCPCLAIGSVSKKENYSGSACNGACCTAAMMMMTGFSPCWHGCSHRPDIFNKYYRHNPSKVGYCFKYMFCGPCQIATDLEEINDIHDDRKKKAVKTKQPRKSDQLLTPLVDEDTPMDDETDEENTEV